MTTLDFSLQHSLSPSSRSRFIVCAYTPTSTISEMGDVAIVERAGQDGVIIIQTSMIKAGRVPTLRAAAEAKGLRQQIWLYELPQQPGTWMTFYQAVNAREEWWLHNPDGPTGARVIERNDRKGFLDFRKPDLRAFLVDHLADWIEGYGLDGYFQDLGNSIRKTDYGWVVTPTTEQVNTYPAGMLAFIRELRARIGTRQIWHNSQIHQFRTDPSSSGYNTDSALQETWDLMAVSDGFMGEGVYHGPWMCLDETRSAWVWEHQMNLIESRAHATGKSVNVFVGSKYKPGPKDASGSCAGTYTGTDWPAPYFRWRDFGFACYWLTFMPGDFFLWHDGGYQDNRPLFDIDVGDPLGPRQKINGVWVREFTRATVKVNLDPAASHDGVSPQRGSILQK